MPELPFLRAGACNASRVLAIVWASVRPSVTLRYCIKQTQARITKSSLWVAARTLVYRDTILCAWVRGFPSNWGVKEKYPLNLLILPLLVSIACKRLQIGTDMLLIITSTGDELHKNVNIDDLE